MEDRLKTLLETGELNREKLRGTIGYMSPELILVGHCSKATDVFAAGVVLYILLCGRPPFNSKSNREGKISPSVPLSRIYLMFLLVCLVLERTAKGIYNISGAEWEDISPEAKDLVRKMLIVNPEERISTQEILAHPWIKQLDEDLDTATDEDVASNASISNHAGQEISSAMGKTHRCYLSISSAVTHTLLSLTRLDVFRSQVDTNQSPANKDYLKSQRQWY